MLSQLPDGFLLEFGIEVVDQLLQEMIIVMRFSRGGTGRQLSLPGVSVGHIDIAVGPVGHFVCMRIDRSGVQVLQSVGRELGSIVVLTFADEVILIQGGRNILQGGFICTIMRDILEEDQCLIW